MISNLTARCDYELHNKLTIVALCLAIDLHEQLSITEMDNSVEVIVII